MDKYILSRLFESPIKLSRRWRHDTIPIKLEYSFLLRQIEISESAAWNASVLFDNDYCQRW
jgi:hypothetical protein